ncbi:Cysteine-Rich Motor Neuron 1 Protein [Manis pentadactyla]|nr:Cysteine-Rich Motor Neuron 1 Protein [Manis pentadactyla]
MLLTNALDRGQRSRRAAPDARFRLFYASSVQSTTTAGFYSTYRYLETKGIRRLRRPAPPGSSRPPAS